jgi:multidrug efflux pump subunit AcrA (membrane-fusion protein)
LIGLLQTLGPNTPVLPLILKGILQNSSLTNRGELIQTLEQMSMPDPQAQQAAQMQQEAQIAMLQAQLADLQAKANKNNAEAQKAATEAALLPEKHKVDVIQAAATNIDKSSDFDKRLKLADMMLKERTVNLKAADIASNERIATLQTRAKLTK